MSFLVSFALVIFSILEGHVGATSILPSLVLPIDVKAFTVTGNLVRTPDILPGQLETLTPLSDSSSVNPTSRSFGARRDVPGNIASNAIV